MANFFDEAGYELQNSWTRTENEPQRLSKAQIANIDCAVVKDNILPNGGVIKNVVFMMKSGKPRSYKLSPYNEQFKGGTKINLSSVVLTEFKNEDDEVRYTMTCEEA